MRVAIFFIFSLFFLNGCNDKHPDQVTPLESMDVAAQKLPTNEESLFFPMDSLHMLGRRVQSDSFMKQKLSKVLFTAREPILFNGNFDQRVFRIIWLRPFDPAIVVRLNIGNRICFANVKVIDNVYRDKSGYDLKLIKDTILRLDDVVCNGFSASIKKADFWTLLVKDQKEELIEDGTEWIFEVRDSSRYHFISRNYDMLIRFRQFEFAQYLYDIGNKVVIMYNHKETSEY